MLRKLIPEYFCYRESNFAFGIVRKGFEMTILTYQIFVDNDGYDNGRRNNGRRKPTAVRATVAEGLQPFWAAETRSVAATSAES